MFKGVTVNHIKVIGTIKKLYAFNSEGDFKNGLSRPKVLGLPGGYWNNTLLILTEEAYNPKNGRSSFGYLMMLDDSFVCAGGHYGAKLSSSREAEANAILFALKQASCRGFSRNALFPDVEEAIDSINGQEDWPISPII